MRPRVIVPLLFALAAALGLVVGAVLPGSSSTPVAADGESTPAEPSEPGEPSAPSDPSDPETSEPAAPQIGEVTGAGGGVSAVNLPQPEFEITKLAPGETPPQFVVVSFDGSGNDAVFHQFVDTADATGAKFTFFVSSIYLLPDEQRFEYTNPGRSPGESGIGFGGAAADVAGRVENYREAYDLFAVNGQLFNHESPRRGETFVTRKITMAVANIVKGNQKELWMGNLDAVRDWGYAPEYTDGMWRMLQADVPEDFVLATGTAYTIRDFLALAFEHVGLDWQEYVKFDAKFLRPTEVDELIGDASKAKERLGWEATVLPPELAKIMVDADIARLGGAPEGQF